MIIIAISSIYIIFHISRVFAYLIQLAKLSTTTGDFAIIYFNPSETCPFLLGHFAVFVVFVAFVVVVVVLISIHAVVDSTISLCIGSMPKFSTNVWVPAHRP